MRILFTTPTHSLFHFGGVAYSCNRITSGLASKGHAITVVVFDKGDQYWDPLKIPNIPCHFSENNVLIEFIPKNHSITGVKIPQSTSLTSWIQQIYLHMKMLVKKHNPDIIVSFYPIPTGYPVSITALEMQIPLILAFRGNDIGRSIHSLEKFPIVIHCLRVAKGAIFVAEDLKRMAYVITPQMPKSHTIYNSIDPNLLKREWRKIRSNDVIFGSIGIFKPKKGIELFVRAIEKLPGFEKRVVLVGDVYKNSNLEGVKTTGILSHSKSLDELNNLDVIVIPSFSEGCPNALLESMAAGRAIITTPVGAMNDLLQHDKSCYMLQDWSDEEMEHAIKKVDTDEAYRLSIAEGARCIAETLTLEREINEWERFLIEMTKG